MKLADLPVRLRTVVRAHLALLYAFERVSPTRELLTRAYAHLRRHRIRIGPLP